MIYLRFDTSSYFCTIPFNTIMPRSWWLLYNLCLNYESHLKIVLTHVFSFSILLAVVACLLCNTLPSTLLLCLIILSIQLCMSTYIK